jgi:E3 ubiquitin-protein ligase HUWE1
MLQSTDIGPAQCAKKSVEAVVHLLINEVMNTTKLINETLSVPALDSDDLRVDADAEGPTSKSESNDRPTSPLDVQDKHQCLCFAMQCLTELLFSYD